MRPLPSVVVFDVNETLSDLAPLADRFTEIGAPESLARVWFATVLRDGFALTVTGQMEPFGRIAADLLRYLVAQAGLAEPTSDAVDHVLAGFTGVNVHPDVPPGVRLLRRAGLRLVTLSNSPAGVAEQLLTKAGLRGEFEALLSVDDAGAWKPARAAYEYAARARGVSPAEMLLVASHPWDVHGASRAGLRTGWIARRPVPYPGYFGAPDLEAPDLVSLARLIIA